jgi:hypothetical protein
VVKSTINRLIGTTKTPRNHIFYEYFHWSKLKHEHPKFIIDHSQSHLPVNQIINAIGKLLENLNDIRNNKSFSHPNEKIIGEYEAKLVINLFHSILQYIDQKVSS